VKKQTLFVLFYLCLCIAVFGQPYPKYFFTQKSERFFSDKEIDDLLYASAKEVFEFNKVPISVLDNNYKIIKPKILVLAKPQIIKQFKTIEYYNETGVDAEEGAKPFNTVKGQYIKYFTREIEQAFLNNKDLRKYLSFNTSDRIRYFHSKVTVQPSGKLLVEETITIYNGDGEKGPNEEDSEITEAGGNNDEIKRGIVRTFPVLYTGKYQLFQNTTFKLLTVERLGEKKESWRLKRQENGYQLFIGNAAHFLEPGLYTYKIVYETSQQIKQLKHFDELVWNVNGNGWNFRIDSSACTIILPSNAVVLSNACYTGTMNDTARDCNITFNKSTNSIVFKSTKPLRPYEGVTVATSWNKGVVAEMPKWDYWWWMFKNNQAVFLMPLLALLFAIYNFFMWWRVGRDPKSGNIYPEFYPPKNLSPAAMGYIYRQSFDNKLVAATITDWAVKRQIHIDIEREGLIFKHNAYKIAIGRGGEMKAEYEDFSDEADSITGTTISKGVYNSGLGSIKRTIERQLDSTYKASKENFFKGLFVLNNWYMAPGNLFTVLGFFYILFGVLTRPGMQNPWHFLYAVIGLILCVAVQSFYYRIIKAYTSEGRKTMDKIEGFRMYLKTADEQRLDAMAPPKKTIELYEAYLPFAIALNCEIEWGEHFKDIIDTASIDPNNVQQMNQSLRRSSFTSSFTDSFSGAISSASSPPSSSSGGGSSFGGGSSGSGGGGGGGGGW
jgi:uncharacterized membrane protein YgcG/translation initiation factor 2 beta subunit (eIF-2beta)/eIF-5